MILFLDTEYSTNDDGAKLLSLALVGDGVEFYCERDDVPPSACSSFVIANVLPHFGLFPSRTGDWGWCKSQLGAFLDSLPGPTEIACDQPRDVELLTRLNNGWPTGLVRPRIPLELISIPDFGEAQHAYHQSAAKPWHHALFDAQALRHAWLAIGGLKP
ncbi:MAG: hypothetical protein OSA97_05890 [Nevskia sp.]|nr:hypothetical protein [Nevskia sp.]